MEKIPLKRDRHREELPWTINQISRQQLYMEKKKNKLVFSRTVAAVEKRETEGEKNVFLLGVALDL